MARNGDAPDELVTVVDLAERWILTEAAAKRLVECDHVPAVGALAPGLCSDWDQIRFWLDAIRRWEADHQIVYRPPSECGARLG
jgi:hypothetical protein